MNIKSVLILGSGHLANRVKKLVAEKGFVVTHFPNVLSNLPDEHLSTINITERALRGTELESFAMTYILYEKDEDNLEIVIAMMALHPDLPIVTSLFNENIRPHLEAANPKLRILNPARIAAPLFVEALNYAISRKLQFPARPRLTKPLKNRGDSFLKILLVSFTLLVFIATAYFHFYEQWPWLDTFYLVIVTISTVGYEDINLETTGAVNKIVAIMLILLSSIFIWLIFSLIIDRIIKRRVELSLGRKKYNYKNHIILCGLGRLGYFIAQQLRDLGERIVIIESNQESANIEHFRSRRIDVYIGNARLPRVLQDAGAEHCRALISVINDDYTNLEIGLNARYFQPNLRLILRIFDESMAIVIKEKFDIHLTPSMSFIAATKFASILDETAIKPEN
ncbi:MAG TPA: potassium channel family protein [Chitinophagales bacterium]|nr:potassium channel family protein [Chitinophagales bacterium]